MSEPYDEVAAALAAARSILFVTGAGISADSGLPTYRGVGGLYAGGVVEDGMTIEEILSGPTFEARPELTWRHLLEVERAARGARPNRGHEVIAALEQTGRRVGVLTQNVDGLHAAAGSRRLIEIHGNLYRLRCTGCGFVERVADLSGLPPLPRCGRCGHVVRPDVVLFEEALPEAAVEALSRELEEGFDAVVAVGTTAGFPYVAGPVVDAAEEGAATVEINPGESLVSPFVRWRLRERAARALDELGRRLGV